MDMLKVAEAFNDHLGKWKRWSYVDGVVIWFDNNLVKHSSKSINDIIAFLEDENQIV